MQDPNTANQGDLIFKLDQDRAWLLKNLDKGKWPEIRSELASLERKISKLIISVQDNIVDICCLLYTSPSPRDLSTSRMPSSA